METGEQEVLLVIADISGYTRFIAENRESLAHSQIIVSELLRAVLKELKVPLQVSKLEGDAVFFYLCKKGNERQLGDVAAGFRERIERIFAAFDRRIAQLVQSNTCPCAGCAGVKMLRLKMVIHSGVALFYRLDRFMELSGYDVILVHRLLKNSVSGDEYVLLSEAARNDLFTPEETMFEESEEQYGDLGKVRTFVYRPRSRPTDFPEGTFDSPLDRWKTDQIKTWTVRLLGWGLRRFNAFRNLPETVEPAANAADE